MFSEALIQDMPESDRKLMVLGFCNPVFMSVATKHAAFFSNRILSLDPDDETFKLDYKVAKEHLSAWKTLLDFAAKYAPSETQWSQQFEVLLTQIGGDRT